MTASPAEPEPEDGQPQEAEPRKAEPQEAEPRKAEPRKAEQQEAEQQEAEQQEAEQQGDEFGHAAAAAPEALAAGFTHRDPGQQGAGFAGGGAADVLPPGPALAGLAAGARAAGLDLMDDDELAGLLCAWRRMSSWAAAGETAAVTEFARRRAAAGLRAIEHLDDEIAALLTLTGRAAGRLTGVAASLARLPRTAAALEFGQIDWPRAVVIAEETCCLSDADAAAVEERVAGAAPGQTTGQLRAAVRRAMLAIDAGAAIKRREKAQKDARVECWTETAGTSALAGRDLPPAYVIAADQRIDALARWLKAHGATGTLDNLRASVFIALLTGQRPEVLLPGRTAPAGPDAPGPDAPGPDAQDWPGGGTGGWPAGLTGSVNLTVPLTTWLGLASEPGDAAGLGALDAGICRDLAAALAADTASRWCLTITGPDGRAVAHGCARAGPGIPRTGPHGTGPTRAGPPGVGPPGTGPTGGGSPGNGPPGTCPPGAGPTSGDRPGAGAPGAGAPGAGLAAQDRCAWLAGIRLSTLETGTCAHPRQTSAYRPSPALRHLINIRDRTCSYPTCRRQATKCDQDHTVPFEQGGRTCECNCGPGCRRHHRAKQAPGWHLHQPEPGRFTWTLPNGRQLTTVPGQYPVP